MKTKNLISKVLRVIAAVVFALLLFIVGLVITLYSPWAQNLVRQGLNRSMDGRDGGVSLSVGSFSLRFPLTLEVGDLAMTQGPDTIMAAESAHADVSILPLLAGRAKIDKVELRKAVYIIGNRDSAMYLTIHADSLGLDDASVVLGDMAISLPQGGIRGGRLGLYMNPDTTPPTKPAPPTKMSIDIGRISLDDFTYSMRMMPTIDTLSAHIRTSVLDKGRIDMLKQQIALGKFYGSGLDARYIAPDSALIAREGPFPTAAPVPDSLKSAPWVVEIDSIDFSESRALYTTAGLKPLPGLDFGYIQVDDLDLRVLNLYNRETTVRVPLSIKGRERCGVDLMVDGTLDIDSVALRFKDVNLSTPASTSAAFSGLMGMGDMMSDPSLPLELNLDGAFAPSDLGKMFPAFALYLKGVPNAEDIMLTADVKGTTGHLDIDELTLNLNRCVSLVAEGSVENVMNPDLLGGDISLKGNIINLNSFKNIILEPATAKTINIPPMTLHGNVSMNRGTIGGKLTAATGKGDIRLDAMLNSRKERYDADVKANQFPVIAFLPDMGVGNVTATIHADGQGFDPFVKTTDMNADFDIKSAEYQNVRYTDISGTAKISGGHADIKLESANPNLAFGITAQGNLDGKIYQWTGDVDCSNIDLYALKFAAEPSSVELMAKAEATLGPTMNDIKATLDISDIYYRQKTGTIGITDLLAVLNASDSLTMLNIANRDLNASFNSAMPIDSLATRFGRVGTLLEQQMGAYRLDIDTLSATLPPFALTVTGGQSNLVNDILAPSKMSVRKFMLSVDNDAFLTLGGFAQQFKTSTMTLDSLYINGQQNGDHLDLKAGLANDPGNMDEWHKVDLKGVIEASTASLSLHQENVNGKTGFELGLRVKASPDSVVTLSIAPLDPIIGYHDWTVNADNFISMKVPTKHIDANLRMQGANSGLALFTEHVPDSTGHAPQEDLVVKLTDIHISDWISFNPFAPPVKGDINADMRLNYDSGTLLGKGSASIANLIYGKEKVADFSADFDVSASTSGKVNATADLMVNGVRTMTLRGALNDSTSTSPLALDFSMIRFPLATANPFLPAGTGRLRGMLNGSLKISGTSEKPIMNGTLDFDSTAVVLAMTGTAYSFSDTPIDVTDNIVHFNRFAITGCNSNPLLVDGTVNISDMADIRMNLSLKADNMMIVNSNRAPKGADIYGKGYISLDASASGSMSIMNVNADLSVLSATNVTYVMTEAATSLSSKADNDMVKFVNFTDSMAVATADTLVQKGMAMFLDATLNIEEGSIVNVDLSTDGQNRIQIQSNGTLTYSMTPLNDGRLIGRLNIDKGFVRYTPPFMSEKNFQFDNNASYVSFTGDMMNPNLNIHATDHLKANVTQAGQNSRLVNFDVLLSVTGTLNQMNVAFDLTTNDDMTVANELESMSPEQRANQAMNMLLYNIYTGPGTKGDASLAGNPLFSFLESKVNSWAANNIRGVDLSFGIDQYDKTVDGSTSSTMRYSYQVSKSLFDDRFKIVVGGNYSTDANADENFSQNLINDISFEYFLNKQRSMYLRLFRHTGYESILEGEITQTGVGFVYRRKIRRLGDMFLSPAAVRRREKEALEREEAEFESHQSDKNEEK